MASEVFREFIPLIAFIGIVVLLWQAGWYLLHAVRVLSRRLPSNSRLLGERLNPRRFRGLPLTVMILAVVCFAVLLGGLIEELGRTEELIVIDRAVNELLSQYRSPVLVDVFSWITDLGSMATLSAVVVTGSALLWIHQRGHVAAAFWISFVGAQATTYAGKFAFARERPDIVTDLTPLTPSFPSGHATGAMVVYGFVAYAVMREMTTLRQRFEIAYWVLVLIVIIGFSRMFLSVHFASDVAAGYLVGGLWLLAGCAVAERLRRR